MRVIGWSALYIVSAVSGGLIYYRTWPAIQALRDQSRMERLSAEIQGYEVAQGGLPGKLTDLAAMYEDVPYKDHTGRPVAWYPERRVLCVPELPCLKVPGGEVTVE